MRPMLVKFPLSRSFGICKAAALLHPAITAEQKFFGALGLRAQKEQIFCKKKKKRKSINSTLTNALIDFLIGLLLLIIDKITD